MASRGSRRWRPPVRDRRMSAEDFRGAAAACGPRCGWPAAAVRTLADLAADGGCSEGALIVRDIVEALDRSGAADESNLMIEGRPVVSVATDAMQLFDDVDKNKDGALSHVELISALKSHPTLAAELRLAKNVREGDSRDQVLLSLLPPR
eukprot:SAG31_NODE_527_length_14452_cov_4.274925_5_plen_150_part_00